MPGIDGPSFESEDETITGGEGNGELLGDSGNDDLEAQYKSLLESVSHDVAKIEGSDDFKALVQEEHNELKAKLESDEGEIREKSHYQLMDLKQEFNEDIEALSLLEKEYSGYVGYTEFMALMNSPQVSETDKESFYDVAVNNPTSLSEYIQYFLGEMFPDSQSLEDFLAYPKVANFIEKDEQNEIISMDINNLSVSDLQYIDNKIEALFTNGIQTNSEIGRQLFAKQQAVKDKIIEENNQEILSQVNINDILDTTQADVDTTQAGVDTTQADVDTTQADVDIAQEDELKNLRNLIIIQVQLFESQNFNIPPKLKSLLVEATLDTADISVMVDAQREVKEFLKTNPGVIKDLLSQARGKSPSVLRQTQQFLGALAESDPEFQNRIKQAELELGLSNIGTQGEIREAQATAYFGGESVEVTDIEIDGQTYTLDDLQIDASDKPPRAYVLGEDGLKLELGLPNIPNDSETLAARRVFSQTQLELNSSLQEISGEYKEKQSKLQRLTQLEQAKQDGEALSPEQETELLTLKNEKTQLEEDVAELKSKIEGIYTKAAEASKAFEKVMSELDFDYKQVQQQQKIARFSLKLMKSFGIDKIGQDRFNQMIAEVKNGQLIVDIDSPNGFDPTKIDIAAGTFGEVQGEPGGQNFRENLARFINLMYFGNSEGKDESGAQLGMNIETFRRILQIENIPGQDPNLVSRMEKPEVNILTSTGDLNVDKARNNLNNGID